MMLVSTEFQANDEKLSVCTQELNQDLLVKEKQHSLRRESSASSADEFYD